MYISSVCRHFFILLTLTIIGSCTTDSGELLKPGWQEAGLAGSSINTVQDGGDLLYTGTGRGVFKKSKSPSINSWQQDGLNIDNAGVVDLIFWDTGDILAAVKYDEVRTDKPTLFKRQAEESMWSPIQVNKPIELDYFVVRFLEKQPSSSSHAVGYVGRIVQSTDGGNSWSIIFDKVGISEFLTVDKHHPDQIWTGGSTNIFSPYLAKSEDGGNTWTLLNDNVFADSDATIYDAILNPEDPDQILAGMGGAVAPANIIRKSSDGGQTWQTVFKGINTRTLTHGAQSSGTVYASGQNDDSTLFFIQTTDFGDTWQTIEMPDSPTGIQVNDMVAVEVEGREVLYLGTNKGVFSYTFEE